MRIRTKLTVLFLFLAVILMFFVARLSYYFAKNTLQKEAVFIIALFCIAVAAAAITKFLHGKESPDRKARPAMPPENVEASDVFTKMDGELKETIISLDVLNEEISMRKGTEDNLKLAAEEWDKTFNSISDWIFVQDLERNIIKANKAFADAVGMKPKDMIGKKCYKIVHKNDIPWAGCLFEDTVKYKKAHTFEVIDPNIGIPLLVTTSPILNDKGEVVAVVHIAKDISKLKEAEKELQKALELRSKFTSMVSHELRTPLTAIKEGIGLVEDGTLGSLNSDQAEFLNVAKRNVDRLTRLINDILDFQKLEAGKMEFKIEENDINKAAREVAETMVSLAGEKGLELIVDLEDNLPKIKFDRDRIVQVLINLLSNAIKFTGKGSVTVITKRENNNIKVSVCDTGIGISGEDMPKLFKSFEQITMGAYRAPGGTGLGLTISKEIIEKQKGKIWAESELGKGTAFYFTLPII